MYRAISFYELPESFMNGILSILSETDKRKTLKEIFAIFATYRNILAVHSYTVSGDTFNISDIYNIGTVYPHKLFCRKVFHDIGQID